MIRVLLPYHLRSLAHCDAEVHIEIEEPATALSLIEALERKYPTLRGAVLEHGTGRRRPKIRFFACKEDISHDAMTKPLPAEVVDGTEPFMIVGAISGG